MVKADEKEPKYSKMTTGGLKKYGSKSPEEEKEVAPIIKKRESAVKVLKKKAKEGSAEEEKGESASYEKKKISLNKMDNMDYHKLGKKLGIDWDKVDYKQFCMGMKCEQEHRDITKGNPTMTAKRVLAHLKELPDYYTRLEKMENFGKSESKENKYDSKIKILIAKSK